MTASARGEPLRRRFLIAIGKGQPGLLVAASRSPLGLRPELFGAGAHLLRGERRLLEALLHQLDDPLIFLGDVGPWTNRSHGSSLRPAPADTGHEELRHGRGDIAYTDVPSPHGWMSSEEQGWGLRDYDEAADGVPGL